MSNFFPPIFAVIAMLWVCAQGAAMPPVTDATTGIQSVLNPNKQVINHERPDNNYSDR
jgi:hypothetical protein